ncbi:MAG: carboxypeptidase-like regulatory domain-containing protein, partial [Bacteroidetes bacterium]|nr:carboxypeptidase-like regulatory domain-containing protein [Bacteroidota bacterium]
MRLFVFCILLFGICSSLPAQESTVSGLLSSGLKPLAQVSVKIADSKMGTTSDSLGRYAISNLKPGNYVLFFSSLGYKPYKA